LNLRPSGYEPDELPGCSTPRRVWGPGGLRRSVIKRANAAVVRSTGLAVTYSPTSWDAVPSALRRLTAEFGMGSGVSLAAVATKPAERTGAHAQALRAWSGGRVTRPTEGRAFAWGEGGVSSWLSFQGLA